MTALPEIIALLPAESDGRGSRVASLLVRDASGNISLQSLNPDSTLGRHALASHRFRQGKPIVDPVSHQIMGYEMEMIETPPSEPLRPMR